jgi:hypothetical protein
VAKTRVIILLKARAVTLSVGGGKTEAFSPKPHRKRKTGGSKNGVRRSEPEDNDV